MPDLKQKASVIALKAVQQVTPEYILPAAISNLPIPENTFLLAIGKAAWKMASTTLQISNGKIREGIVLTNYGNAQGPLEGLEVLQASHPFPDDNSLKYTEMIINKISQLTDTDDLLVLLSGGGSALLEKPLPGLDIEELNRIIRNLMLAGADIFELNTVRKHLSAVKGGRLANYVKCKTTVFALSDVMGDDLSVLASGPFYQDNSSSESALNILRKYEIELSATTREMLQKATPEEVGIIDHKLIGNNRLLCEKALEIAENMGYNAYLYPLHLAGEAFIMGKKVGKICKQISSELTTFTPPCAIILGGETVVQVKGKGVGGRNLELLLGAATELRGVEHVTVCSLASDGIDGNSPAAGGVINGGTLSQLEAAGIILPSVLKNNDSYTALHQIKAVMKIGPTGTNVNDLVIMLIE